MVKTITKNAFSIFIVFLAYFIPAKLGFFIALPPDNATAIWPASGIAAASVIFFGYKTLPGVFLGSLVANLTNFTCSLDLFIDKTFIFLELQQFYSIFQRTNPIPALLYINQALNLHLLH